MERKAMKCNVTITQTVSISEARQANYEIQFGEHERVFKIWGGSLEALLVQVERFGAPGIAIDVLTERANLMAERNKP